MFKWRKPNISWRKKNKDPHRKTLITNRTGNTPKIKLASGLWTIKAEHAGSGIRYRLAGDKPFMTTLLVQPKTSKISKITLQGATPEFYVYPSSKINLDWCKTPTINPTLANPLNTVRPKIIVYLVLPFKEGFFRGRRGNYSAQGRG